MMANVSEFKRTVDRALIKKLFHKFTSVYGHAWTSRHKTDAEWEECCTTWFDGLHGFDFEDIRKAVAKSITVHKEFPPNLGQLIDLCLMASGVPSADEVIELMVRRDFNHPLVKAVYDRIGNWTLSTSKSEELRTKTRSAYADCLTTYRENPDRAWGLLEEYKAQAALPPPPPKIPTQEEIIGFRERMKLYEEKSKAEKLKLGDKSHPEWPKELIARGGKRFDEKVFNERKQYLLELDEILAMTLTHEDRYDRICFLREIEAARHLQKVGYTGRQPEPPKTPPRGHFGAKKVYNTWSN